MKMIAGLIVASLVLSTGALFAQNGPRNGQGKGYGGPPQSEEERAARQADCLEKNGGVCPNGGPRQDCDGQGMGQGNGRGMGAAKGQGKGAMDGTGPRGANGKGFRGGR